jgi:4-amino-4-deoxy-L-arabinose transferase-like glycosyltransferase
MGAPRPAPFLATPAGFAVLLAAYALVHVALRVAVSSAVTIDDARETVFAQTLAWGYQPRQPPLYNWLVWGAFRLLGPGVLALSVVKYAVLATAYAFLYASARRVLRDPRLPTLATFGLLLVVPVSWILHEALTHSVTVLAACAATLYLLLRVEASGSVPAHLGLGAALGLGLLSKFSFAVFAAALLLAAATVPPFRARLRSSRFLLSLAVAAALVLPYALWYAGHGFAFLRMASAEVRAGQGEDHLEGVVDGLFYVAKVTLIYATPLWLVCLALVPQVYRRPLRLPAGAPAGARLVERFLLGVVGLLTGGALLTLVTFLKFRWLLPGFFLLPLLAFARLDAAGVRPAQLRRLAVVLLLAEAAVIGGILLRIGTGHLGGRPYKLNEPYDRLAAGLREAGFRDGTIVAGRGPVGGNLRLQLPGSRVLSLESPYYVPPARGTAGQCLVVWERGGAERVPPDLRDFVARVLDVSLDEGAAPAIVEALVHHTSDKRRRLAYVLLPGGAGGCR